MANLKVKDLIAELSQLDPEKIVEIEISQYNRVYPVAYIILEGPGGPRYSGSVAYEGPHGTVRIPISLPDNMRTSILKGKQPQGVQQ